MSVRLHFTKALNGREVFDHFNNFVNIDLISDDGADKEMLIETFLEVSLYC